MSLPSFFPLCTIVPAVSAGAVVQTFRKQQGQLCKVKKEDKLLVTPSEGKLIIIPCSFLFWTRVYPMFVIQNC